MVYYVFGGVWMFEVYLFLIFCEFDILCLIVDGLFNKDIVEVFGVSVSIVKLYI